MRVQGTVTEPLVEDRLCVALAEASRMMTMRYRSILADLRLTYPQYIAMSWLWQHGEMSVSDLAERMDLDRSTISPLVKRLEGAGLAHRRRDATDERRVLVSVTDQGSALEQQAKGVPAAISAATGLSEAEQQELVARLRRLSATLAP